MRPAIERVESVRFLIEQLVADGKSVATAEIELYKAKFGERKTSITAASKNFAIAAVLALSALITLLVGLVLSLATLIGPFAATLCVVAVVLVIALLFALRGRNELKRPTVGDNL